MSASATEQFIGVLSNLKPGDLGLLRTHSGQGLDETVSGFDLFAGLWWPLRQKSQRAPRREVAWLITKLYAYRPIPHVPGRTFACQVRRSRTGSGLSEAAIQNRFDHLLLLPLDKIEPALQWALGCIASGANTLDWTQFTDDLSIWERESTRLKWANEYLNSNEREPSC